MAMCNNCLALGRFVSDCEEHAPKKESKAAKAAKKDKE